MSNERKEVLEVAIKAHLNAIDDRMTVHDSESELTRDVQFHVEKIREVTEELLGSETVNG